MRRSFLSFRVSALDWKKLNLWRDRYILSLYGYVVPSACVRINLRRKGEHHKHSFIPFAPFSETRYDRNAAIARSGYFTCMGSMGCDARCYDALQQTPLAVVSPSKRLLRLPNKPRSGIFCRGHQPFSLAFLTPYFRLLLSLFLAYSENVFKTTGAIIIF